MRSQEKSLLNLNLNHNQMRIPLHFLMTKSRIEATLLRPPECDRVTGWRDDAGDPTPVTTQTRPSQNIFGCFSSKLWRSDHYVSSTSNSVSLTTMFTTSEWHVCNQAVSNQHVSPLYGGEFFLYTSARKRRPYSRGSLRMRNYLFWIKQAVAIADRLHRYR